VDDGLRELEAAEMLNPGYAQKLRKDLIEQYVYPEDLTDHILDGLAKAGMTIE
jgi:hypothetical protein